MSKRVVILLALLAGLPLPAYGEGDPRLLDPHTAGTRLLLYRPGPLTYDNYGLEGYRTWPRNLLTRTTNPIYDEFGGFLVNGVEAYRLQETRRFDDPVQVFTGSHLDKSSNYQAFLSRLMVADDSYKDWQTRLIIGDRIRTRFTPLVLDMAALNGVRWDLSNQHHGFTVVTSRLDRPVFAGTEGTARTTAFAAYLLGSHWQWRWRTIDLSASYVNMFRIDSRSPSNWNGMRGQLPNVVQPVEYLVVRIEDSSMRDGGGTRVFDVALYLDGEKRDDIAALVTRHNTEDFDALNVNGARLFERPIPPYVEVLRDSRYAAERDAGDYFSAAGRDYLLFWFPIPTDGEVEGASFEVLVSGDYRIHTAEIYVIDPNTSAVNNRYLSTPYQEVAGSEGRGTAGAGLRQVRFKYGRQTGVTLGDLRLATDVKGFQLKAEWARSFNFLQYPISAHAGTRHDRGGNAWLVNFERELTPQLSAGGEWFRLEPDYTTRLAVTDFTLGGSYEQGFVKHNLNYSLDLNPVDDNDDKDPFPDQVFLPAFEDNNGVFPGLDRDQDGTPDTNRNRNGTPDYFEPFLLYDVDPDDFDYGDDLNNNGVIDHRENDRKQDYPYDLNREGYHLFGRIEPRRGLQLTLGRYAMEAIRGGQRTAVWYAKTEYRRRFAGWGEVKAVEFLKRVRDDIPDDVFRYGDLANFNIFTPRGITRPAPFVEDALLMRNSLVSTAFVDFGFSGWRNFFAGANVKFDANRQLNLPRGGGNLIRLWTSVLRADYRWRLGELEVTPRFKFMLRKRSDDEGVVHSFSELFTFPMVVANYRFTENSWLRGGIQGFSAMPGLYRNLEDGDLDYDTRDYLVMLVNHFDYAGYDMALTAGYQVSQRDMKDRSRAVEDIDFEHFFIRAVVGLEPLE